MKGVVLIDIIATKLVVVNLITKQKIATKDINWFQDHVEKILTVDASLNTNVSRNLNVFTRSSRRNVKRINLILRR